jgi:hypothetical protein
MRTLSMLKPSSPLTRLTLLLRKLQQALEASAQGRALFCTLRAPSCSRLH